MLDAAQDTASSLKGSVYLAVNGKIVSRSILPVLDQSWIVWIRMTGNGKIDTALLKP